MEKSARLSLSYIAPQQSQKHVPANESFRLLDALVQLAVKSRSVRIQPGDPQEGDGYILPPGKSGAAWEEMSDGALAVFQDAHWREISPADGVRAYVLDESALYVFEGGAWGEIIAGGSGSGSPETAPRFGVNAVADDTNRLTVKADAELLSYDESPSGSGDARKIINRQTASDVASVVFQTNYQGSAEFGLVGGEAFQLKMSEDGSTFHTALSIDPTTRYVGFGVDAPEAALHIEPEQSGFVTTMRTSVSNGLNLGYFDTFQSENDFASSYIILQRGRGTKTAPGVVVQGDWLGGVAFRGHTGDTGFLQRALLGSIIDGPVSGLSQPQALVFYSGVTAQIERVRIASSGDVGIGITSPRTKLDVDGPIRCKSYTVASAPSASSAGAGAIIYLSNAAGGAVLAFSDGASWRRTTDRAVVAS